MSSAERALDPHNTTDDKRAAEDKRAAGRGNNKRLEKSADAFRTISEVADELEVPQHVLRFWETKFTQIRPMKRGGGRRYYRPEDVDLLRSIRGLLYDQGYTIKGVQKLIREGGLRLAGEGLAGAELPGDSVEAAAPERAVAEEAPAGSIMDLPLFRAALDDGAIREVKSVIEELTELRDRLRHAAQL